jgi:hypothetical protein
MLQQLPFQRLISVLFHLFFFRSKPLGSAEEDKLASMLESNETICKLGLDLRGMLPQTELDRKLNRNRELARIRRQQHGTSNSSSSPTTTAASSSTSAIKLPKNKMQQYFGRIGANDASITTVEIVADKLFLMLKPEDRLAAARSLAVNTHVTSVRMTMVQLDDAFALALADAIRQNATITKVVLDSNTIGSDGIKALVQALAHNTTITEFQIRHQSKKNPMATADEELLLGLLGDNETLVKLGVDLRSPQAQRGLDHKMAKNRDLQRQVRRSRSFDK